jgi:PelA/Pel-15E family pectate lyase
MENRGSYLFWILNQIKSNVSDNTTMKVLTVVIPILFHACPLMAGSARDYLDKPNTWFNSTEGKKIISTVLSHRDKNGIWPKNIDTTQKRTQKGIRGTFDNSATLNELRLLAHAFQATDSLEHKSAFVKGLECILNAQYRNGGWPQRPEPSGYSQHITFNDGTMVGILNFLREIHSNKRYGFVPDKIIRRTETSFEKGIQCILKCQIKVNGQLTAWCAQHDKITFAPRGARSYEHPSISGGESAGITCLLMSLQRPPEDVKKAIRAAVKWYEHTKITGIRYKKINGDHKIMKDPDAPVMWARFYEIKTNRPIFSGRDGKIKYAVSDIEFERRNGYAWYVRSGSKVANTWQKWKFK